MTDGPDHEMPELSRGWMHVWGHPLQDLGGADRGRPLPLRPLPAAIGQRLLDRHHHQTLDNKDRRRNRRLRRYRLQRPPCCAPILPALRVATHDRTRCDAGSDVRESRRHRRQRMVPSGHGVVRGPATALGRPGSGRTAARRQSANLRVRTMNQFQDLFDRQKHYFATGVTRSHGWRIEQLDRMSRLVAENEAALQKAIAQDFKTASQEQIFETRACLGEVAFQKSQLDEWMKPVEAPCREPSRPPATWRRLPRSLWSGADHRSFQRPAHVAACGPRSRRSRPAIAAFSSSAWRSRRRRHCWWTSCRNISTRKL